ncbi:MAG: PilZ domain-containing protein [Planctomycetota bacterium]
MGSTFNQMQPERRQFVRLATDIPVRYKFLSRVIDLGDEQIYEGRTTNLSAGGCLLVAKIPNMNWIPALLMGKILMGVNLLLPSVDEPIKALCMPTWMESFEEPSQPLTLGVTFNDLPKQHQDEITRYIIRSQMTTTRA